MRILLVEDEVRLTDALKYLLSKEKIEVDVANDGDSGLLLAKNQIYDVIVLDIMLPGNSGLEILKTIRKEGNTTPVLLLTAKDTVEDKVKGLNLGADDYLVKPFAVPELVARIRSLGRRFNGKYNYSDNLVFGNIEYIKDSYVLKIDNKKVSLSAKEGMLLEMMIRRPEQVFTKEQIINRIWGYESDVTENNVEVIVHHLRKKLKKGSNVEIKTIRNVGYKLTER